MYHLEQKLFTRTHAQTPTHTFSRSRTHTRTHTHTHTHIYQQQPLANSAALHCRKFLKVSSVVQFTQHTWKQKTIERIEKFTSAALHYQKFSKVSAMVHLYSTFRSDLTFAKYVLLANEDFVDCELPKSQHCRHCTYGVASVSRIV